MPAANGSGRLQVRKTYKLYVNGEFVRSESGRAYTPSGDVNVPRGSRKDLRDAVRAARTAWHSGWPRTPLSMVPGTASAPAYFVVGDRNSARWGDYFTADARIARSMHFARGELSLWIDATNLTNRPNYVQEFEGWAALVRETIFKGGKVSHN